MGALKLFKYEIEESHLDAELQVTATLTYKKIELVKKFLEERNIYTLANVTLQMVYEFTEHILNSKEQKDSWSNGLEVALRDYYIREAYPVLSEIEALDFEDRIKRKLIFFLPINHINHFDEIDVDLRIAFEKYIAFCGLSRTSNYVRALDKAKLLAIEEANTGFISHKLKYESKMLFLGYHPDIDIARKFEYAQVKDPLFFDFAYPASDTLKHQIFSMLKYFVEDCPQYSRHYLIQMEITPLWNLYNFCCEYGITDISKLLESDVKAFYEYVKEHNVHQGELIINQIRRHIFLNSPVINWDDTVWYLDRFKLAESRKNLARPFESFSFDTISNEDNRKLLMAYIKYLIAVSSKFAIQTVYGNLAYCREFLCYLDEKNITLSSIKRNEIENYINYLFSKGNKEASVNTAINTLSAFFDFLEVKELITPLAFPFEYYRATDVYAHNDISVADDDIEAVFSVLDTFPEDIRLMYLNLWSVGLRVNEVCAIRANAYSYDGSNAWLLVYQPKAKSEKRVPIPYELYVLMKDYIKRNRYTGDAFIFPAPKCDGPYRAGTLVKKINRLLDEAGISETYHFRSHGYRHTLATTLYNDGENIQTIREYLGHNNIDMTKQYIDHLPNMIDGLNKEYFSNKGGI